MNQMNRRSILLVLLFFIVLRANSQVNMTLTGTVIDSLNQKPLEFCNIIFKNITDTSKQRLGCMTNNEGRFKIAIPLGYDYIMQFSMVGYKTFSDTAKFKVEDEDEENVDYSAIPEDKLILDMGFLKLPANINLLETVTVSESTKSMTIDKQSVIVTPKMLENTIAAKDVLAKVDGVIYNRITNDIKLDNDKKVKILVDGIEKDKDYILNLNPKLIKKIEIVRNIIGIYQIEGYNSIINIITYDNYRGYDLVIDDQYLYKFKTSNNPYFVQNNANININITRDKWNYYIKTSGNYNDMALYNKSITEFTTSNETIINSYNDEPNMNEKSVNYKFKLGSDYKINKKQLMGAEINIKGFPAKNTSNIISFDTLKMNNITTISKNTINSNSDFYDISGNLYYNNNIDSTSKLITYFYYTNTKTNSHQYINNDNELNYKKTSNNLNYKIEYEEIFKNKYTLTTGARFFNNNFKSIAQDTIQSDFKNNYYKLTAYAYFKIKFNKNTGLLFGSSIEHYKSENDETIISFNSAQPRLNLYKTINDKHKFMIEYSLNTNYPYLSDMNPQITYLSPFIASMGNPELTPYLYHNFSFEYSKMSAGVFSNFSIKPYYNFSDNEMGLKATTNDSLIIYQNKNFVKHENYGLKTSLSIEIKEKLTIDFDFDIYKDWNKNLTTSDIIDWYGGAQIAYTLNTKHYFGLMYQKENSKTVNSLGYSKDGTDFIMIYWMTLQLKGRLQFMLGYSMPLLPTQTNETYEKTQYYQKTSYTNVSIIKNMVMINLVFRLSKGKVNKVNKDINYENFDKPTENKLNIGL